MARKQDEATKRRRFKAVVALGLLANVRLFGVRAFADRADQRYFEVAAAAVDAGFDVSSYLEADEPSVEPRHPSVGVFDGTVVIASGREPLWTERTTCAVYVAAPGQPEAGTKHRMSRRTLPVCTADAAFAAVSQTRR